MLFSTRRDKPDSEPLILNGTEISFCSSVKYLGVEVDDRLRFEDHIENKPIKGCILYGIFFT